MPAALASAPAAAALHPAPASDQPTPSPALRPCIDITCRFSWNKGQLEKARDEGRTQTNPLATAVRGVLSGVPTALLVVASITKLEDTSYNK